jgi:hypothetical protein
LVVRNWLVGPHLLEFEQSGQDRATYGEQLLSNLAADLKIRGLKGLRISMLKNCRQFYRVYPDIRQSLAARLVERWAFYFARQTVETVNDLWRAN